MPLPAQGEAPGRTRGPRSLPIHDQSFWFRGEPVRTLAQIPLCTDPGHQIRPPALVFAPLPLRRGGAGVGSRLRHNRRTATIGPSTPSPTLPLGKGEGAWNPSYRYFRLPVAKGSRRFVAKRLLGPATVRGAQKPVRLLRRESGSERAANRSCKSFLAARSLRSLDRRDESHSPRRTVAAVKGPSFIAHSR